MVTVGSGLRNNTNAVGENSSGQAVFSGNDEMIFGIVGTINVPDFPAIFFPITIIVGFLGAVLLIQKTRKH
jgi:hypothetical protein